MTEDPAPDARSQAASTDFVDFVVKSTDRLWPLALREAGSDFHTAEDILQDTFLRMFRLWDRISLREGSLHTYARKAVRSAVVDLYRRNGCGRVEPSASLPDAVARTTYGSIPGAEELSDLSVLALEAIERLPPQQQRAVTLLYLHEMPIADVAEAMGVKPESVGRYLRAATKTLETMLVSAGKDVAR
ncbi:RNA polymerase sigma factor [Streptacidiphilus sp. N1-12]|uniref:RNA polymerase sigma factor n=2 Tax=Streptacidiphilus alkalitolerans TaxID=3342712 RepID=A0ABV6WLZ0_9ACTN